MKKNTKKAVLTSVFSLVTCFVMLLGTTYAWFTDSDTISGNEVVAGTLDVQIVDASGNPFQGEGTKLTFVKNASAPAGQAIKWEPGCTYQLTPFKVKNNGDLALTYKFDVSGFTGENAGKLAEAIDWSFKIGETSYASLEGNELTLAPSASSDSIVICGTMKTTATGEDVMGKSLDGITITVYAKQAASEYDSNGNSYDASAAYTNAAS